MAARAIGSGTIAFGLVSIPVKLFSSSSPSHEIHFNQLHASCGSRVRQKLYCPEHDAIIGRDEIVKGYEFAKGQYVTFSSEELKAVEAQATGGIDIVEFVPLDDVDPLYFDRAYYLGPDKGAARAYNLLGQALRETGLCAIATYAARGKQYLTLIRAAEEGLVLQQLHHDYEVRPFSEVPIGDAEVKGDELQLAIQLIKQSVADEFDPSKYHDDVRERIEELIARKVEGEDITAAPSETPKAQVIDLMEALKASLGEGGESAGSGSKKSQARKGPQRTEESTAKTGRKRTRTKKTAKR